LVYASSHGVTDIVLPRLWGIRTLFGVQHVSGVLRLGPFYYLYMSMLSTFCTNSINILAGVNGVEVSQSLVIALSILLNDILYIPLDISPILGSNDGGVRLIGFGADRGSRQLQDRHLFSFWFMCPLVGVSLGLLRWNWYPAKAFIGDTFCYFSGMAFAVVGILGHFSKTLLLFFVPQVFNFLYSCPQLFKLVYCPRHRLPFYNPKTGLLEPSIAFFDGSAAQPYPSRPVSAVLLLLGRMGLVKVIVVNKKLVGISNLTLLNLVLLFAGPMREDKLTKVIIAIQSGCSVLAFVIRYAGAGWFYEGSRR